MSLLYLFINDPRKTFQKQKKTFACALQNDSCDEIEYVQGKMWNPASANLTCDFIKMVLHHGHIIAECFYYFFDKAISLNSSDYF